MWSQGNQGEPPIVAFVKTIWCGVAGGSSLYAVKALPGAGWESEVARIVLLVAAIWFGFVGARSARVVRSSRPK